VAGIEKVRRDIGRNIRNFRKRASMSQEKLAEAADLHPVYVSQVERGKKAVSVETLWKLSKALRVTMAAFLKGV
jgi:transcriptional regulator with XRE-family HTH domain